MKFLILDSNPNRKGDDMKKFGCFVGFKALILDIDNTVYDSPEYFQDGQAREQIAVAEMLGIQPEQLRQKIHTYEHMIGEKPTVTETVYHLGVTPLQWSELRQKAWRPENF